VLQRLLSFLGTPRARAIACFVSMYTAVGASAPYLPVYYQSLGMPLNAIGLLAAVVAVSSLFASPAWGLLGDRFHRTRLVLPLASLLAAAFAGVLSLAHDPSFAALVAVLFWLAYAGVGPLLDARALETVAEDQHRYSRLRAWGSAAFVVSTVAVGALVQATELRSLFIVLIGGLLVTALFALGLRPSVVRLQLPRLTGLQAVLRDRVLISFLGAVLATWSASSAINAFFSIHLVAIGAGGALVGIAWALGAAVEIPLMIVFPQLARRFGVERLVVAGALLLVLRAITITLVSDPLLVTLTMLLHGAGFALLLVGGVTYVARHAPSGAAATAQGVLSGITFGLAAGIGPGLGGLVASSLGLNTLFGVASIVGAIGILGLTLAFGLRPIRRASPRTAADTPR
jgi:PPP family 3-phenylpropionic acid transporter